MPEKSTTRNARPEPQTRDKIGIEGLSRLPDKSQRSCWAVSKTEDINNLNTTETAHAESRHLILKEIEQEKDDPKNTRHIHIRSISRETYY